MSSLLCLSIPHFILNSSSTESRFDSFIVTPHCPEMKKAIDKRRTNRTAANKVYLAILDEWQMGCHIYRDCESGLSGVGWKRGVAGIKKVRRDRCCVDYNYSEIRLQLASESRQRLHAVRAGFTGDAYTPMA